MRALRCLLSSWIHTSIPLRPIPKSLRVDSEKRRSWRQRSLLLIAKPEKNKGCVPLADRLEFKDMRSRKPWKWRPISAELTVALGNLHQKGQWPSACEVVSLVHQSLLHRIISHQENHPLPAQVDGHHRPVGFTELREDWIFRVVTL